MNLIKVLFENQDLEYKKFREKLVPSLEKDKIIGVRIPLLRKIYKDLKKEKSNEELSNLFKKLECIYQEEKFLYTLFLFDITDIDLFIESLNKFLPYIDNWETCDAIKTKLVKKHSCIIYEEIKKFISSNDAYTIRLGIVLLLTYYLDEYFEIEHLNLIADIKSEEYYVNMAIAWYFSYALIKQYDLAIKYIEDKKLSKWVHNKSIQKALESFRISEDKKKYLKTLRIR